MKWSILFLMLVAVSATDFTRLVDSELGYVEATGFIDEGSLFELAEQQVEARVVALKDFKILNYSVRVTPRNIERLAIEYGVPLSDSLNVDVPAGSMEEITLDVPDLVCGTYTVSGELYYVSESVTGVHSDSLKLKVPCKDFKSRLVYGLLSGLPYPILKGLMNLLGIRLA